MRVLVTGANGQLGTDLCRVLRDFEVIGLTHAEADITDLSSFSRHLPEIPSVGHHQYRGLRQSR